MKRRRTDTYHVTFACCQALTSEIDSEQAAGAGGVEVAAGALEVEEPTEAIRQHGGLEAEGGMARALLSVLEVELLPVVGKAASEDGGVRPDYLIHDLAR